MIRILVAVALLISLGGCVNMLAQIAGDAAGIPLDNRTVSSKMEPNTLVATDGATCTVSKGRWEKAKPGDDVLCAWRGVERHNLTNLTDLPSERR